MALGRQSGFLERLILPSLPLLILLLLIFVDLIHAADPNQPLNSYLRTRFANEDGLYSNLVGDVVQSQDGFLWLVVNSEKLSRFDGRHFSVFEGLGTIVSLALAPNGDLWVGTTKDLKQIPASALTQFGRLPAVSYHPDSSRNIPIATLRFTRNGVLWVGTPSGLYRFEHGVFSPAIPGAYIERIEETANGHLWVSTRTGPMEWDGSRAIPHPELATQLGVADKDIFHVFEDSHGVTWFCTKNGVARRVSETMEKLAPWGPQGHGAYRVYEDPSGRIWFATAEGLFRATATGLELVAKGMNVRHMYGDRDGNLWVGTNGDGLFRFKDRVVRIFTTADGLPSNVTMSVLARHDGAVWAGFNCGGITRFDGQRFQIYNEKNGLLNSCVYALAEDVNHDLWLGTWGGGIFRFHDGRFTQYSKAQGLGNNNVRSLIAARDGSIWAAGGVVSRIHDEHIRNYTTADGVSSDNFGVYEDRAGEILASGFQGTSRLDGDRFVGSSLFPKGVSFPIGEDRSGGLYFMLELPGGVFRIANNQTIQIAPDLDAFQMLETKQGDLWISGASLVRFPPGGLDHPHQKDDPLDFETFGPADGLVATMSGGYPVLALSPDGKLWIATDQGLAMLDLLRLPRTDRKPAIYINGITVDRNQQLPGHELVLPAGTHHLELSFDAIEISSPEKIRLQYRLDNMDSEWLDAGSPGHATYSTLPPGTHAFHVRACNRSGIWDRVGTVYYVTQQPHFYQTRWFLAATIALGLIVIAGLYQLRMRQVAGTLSARFEGRLAERTRIARELHDTLLQTFTASLLRFQSVSKMLPGRPEDAKQRVDNAIEQASNAIAEGRDAVHQLRSASATPDLAQSISNFVSELASSFTGGNSPEFHVHVEGTPRDLNPIVPDEAYRIAAEALRNAVRYAEAGKIEVEIRYDEQQLRLRIRDDGKGLDANVLDQGQAPGHWGLPGMRERAKLVGGKFEVWSKVGSGTEAELTIPAASAYAKPSSRWTTLLRRVRN